MWLTLPRQPAVPQRPGLVTCTNTCTTHQPYACPRHSGRGEVLTAGVLQAGRAPHGEPPAQLGLDLQVRAERAADLELQRVVPPLPAQRGERVERPALVQVDQPQAAALGVP